MREELVRHAVPQKNWPIVEMISTISTADLVSALLSTAIDEPAPSLTALTSVAANVIASSRIQPITAEKKIERQTPLAADSAAPCVSSEMCAHESKPVIVYCVSRKPSGNT